MRNKLFYGTLCIALLISLGECREKSVTPEMPEKVDYGDIYSLAVVNCYLCPDETLTLDPQVGGGTTPYTYEWSTSATSPTIDITAAGSYFVTTTDANGCEIIDEFIVEGCSATITYTGDNTESCEDLVVTISGTCVGPFSWDFMPTGTLTETGMGTGTSFTIPSSYEPTGANGTYEVIFTDVNGCEHELSIDYEACPVSGPEIKNCTSTFDCDAAGDNLEFDITYDACIGCSRATPYRIDFENGTIFSGGVTINQSNVTFTNINSACRDFTLTNTVRFPCDPTLVGQTATMSVDIVENISGTVLKTVTETFTVPDCCFECPDGEVEITGDCANGYTWDWIGGVPTGCTSTTAEWYDATTNALLFTGDTYTPTGSGSFYVIVTCTNFPIDCEYTSADVSYDCCDCEIAGFAIGDLCEGDVFTINAQTTGCVGAISYCWGSGCAGGTSSSFSFSCGCGSGCPISSGVTLLVTDANGCTDEYEYTYTCQEKPDVTISGDCNGLTSSIVGSCNNPTYQWLLNGSPISGATSSTFDPPEGMVGTITLEVTCDSDCSGISNGITVDCDCDCTLVLVDNNDCTLTATRSGSGCDNFGDMSILQYLGSNCSGPPCTVASTSGNTLTIDLDAGDYCKSTADGSYLARMTSTICPVEESACVAVTGCGVDCNCDVELVYNNDCTFNAEYFGTGCDNYNLVVQKFGSAGCSGGNCTLLTGINLNPTGGTFVIDDLQGGSCSGFTTDDTGYRAFLDAQDPACSDVFDSCVDITGCDCVPEVDIVGPVASPNTGLNCVANNSFVFNFVSDYTVAGDCSCCGGTFTMEEEWEVELFDENGNLVGTVDDTESQDAACGEIFTAGNDVSFNCATIDLDYELVATVTVLSFSTNSGCTINNPSVMSYTVTHVVTQSDLNSCGC